MAMCQMEFQESVEGALSSTVGTFTNGQKNRWTDGVLAGVNFVLQLSQNVAAETVLVSGAYPIFNNNNVPIKIYDNTGGNFWDAVITSTGTIVTKSAINSGHSLRASFVYLV